MPLRKRQIQILNVLYKNLQNARPKPVPSVAIAGKLGMNLPELRELLTRMNGKGVIQTDLDQRYNLITRKGVTWLDNQRPYPDPAPL